MSRRPVVGRSALVGLVAVLVVALIGTTGCGSLGPGPTAAATPRSGPARVSPSSFLPESPPTRVVIPALGVDARTIELGLRRDGTMEVPASGATIGWYSGAPTPGELGPAVITGHAAWRGAPGVFADLQRLEAGDDIGVLRADGTLVVFDVLASKRYAKDEFPTEEVYGDIQYAGLRLITCAGQADPETGKYPDNVVVYAGLVGAKKKRAAAGSAG